jgi:hypothetical protein
MLLLLFHLLLQDGRNWARIEGDHHTGALFDVGAEGEWDAAFIGHPCVLAAGPKDIRMWYHSYDAAAGRYRVGLATSRDGFAWQKQGPVFGGGSSEGDHDARGAAACHVVSAAAGVDAGCWCWPVVGRAATTPSRCAALPRHTLHARRCATPTASSS